MKHIRNIFLTLALLCIHLQNTYTMQQAPQPQNQQSLPQIIMGSIFNGNMLEVIQAFIEAGGDINMSDPGPLSITALHVVTGFLYIWEEGNLYHFLRPDIVKYLCQQKNILPNKTAGDLLTALHRVAKAHPFPGEEQAQLDILRFLSQAKDIDMNAQTNHGETPLHIATIYGNKNTVAFLASHPDVDVNLQNDTCQTSLQIAFSAFEFDEKPPYHALLTLTRPGIIERHSRVNLEATLLLTHDILEKEDDEIDKPTVFSYRELIETEWANQEEDEGRKERMEWTLIHENQQKWNFGWPTLLKTYPNVVIKFHYFLFKG